MTAIAPILALVPDSPVPLYHQIAEAVRYRIATGALPAGTRLPTLREAAQLWGVNLHTVRHAYAELVKGGLVTTSPREGTRVVASPETGRRPPVPRGAIDAFARRVLHQARSELGAELPDLVAALERTGRAPAVAHPTVTVTECTAWQCEDLARQLEARWRVAARPWCFTDRDPAAPLPPGIIVGTYFHYNELRAAWPERRGDFRFVVIMPDPGVAERVRAERGDRGRTRLYLCELDASMARNIAADLLMQLPRDDYEVMPLIVEDPPSAFERTGEDAPILFPPRAWGRLADEDRRHPQAYELRYRFDPDDADRIAREFHWRSV